jgi:hypothetical protein
MPGWWTASPSPDFGSRFLGFFAMFGRGETKISLVAGADENGFTVMYDQRPRPAQHLPPLPPERAEAAARRSLPCRR